MADVSELVLNAGEIRQLLNAEVLQGPENPHGIDRAPFLITTERDIPNNKYIFLYCNPAEVSFQQGMRGAEQKVRGGAVQHVWFDRNGNKSFFDEPTLGFQFQSGNTIPVIINEGAAKAAPGLNNVFDLLDLLDQPRVLDDGRPNYVYIVYTSRNFPSLTLVGFFTPEGFSFTDSADDPTVLNLSANFLMYDSYPRLSSANVLVQMFADYGMRGLNNRPTTQSDPNAPPPNTLAGGFSI